MEEEVKWLIALGELRGVGPATVRSMVARLGSAEAVMHEGLAALKKLGFFHGYDDVSFSDDKTAALRRAQEELDFLSREGKTAISFKSERYPFRLRNIDDAPTVIFQWGDIDLGQPTKVLSVVGTRKSTPTGCDICEKIIADLSQKYPGLVIVSGLAYGIDACAHRAAMANGLRTVGVVAHGLDRIYPRPNARVAEEMVSEGGAVITEYKVGTNADPQNFVKRNRVVAGMTDATLVVESAEKGGALITASIMRDYGRPVFAVPGSPKAEVSRGCNGLIKSGIAFLAEEAEDIEKILKWEAEADRKPIQGKLFAAPATAEQQTLYNHLAQYGDMSASSLSVKCEMPVSRVNSELFELEILGLVRTLPGNNYHAIR